MAWDFSTDPEFEEHLAWMRDLVRDEIWPIEAIADEIEQPELDRLLVPLKERVKERGLWAAHLPPELGGQGFGQVKLGLMNEILGTSIYAPLRSAVRRPTRGTARSSLSQVASSRRSVGCTRCSGARFCPRSR